MKIFKTRDTDQAPADAPMISRRNMLAKLGLAASAAYAAPLLLQLGEAKASGPSRGSAGSRNRRRVNRAGSASGSHGRDRRHVRRSGRGSASGPSRGSR